MSATAPARPAERPWRTAIVAVAGLLVVIAAVGVAGITINGNIHRTVERAIGLDVALEDRGDNLRVAILEVRHYHRDLVLDNPDPARIELWRQQYAVLVEEIDAVADVLASQPEPAQDLEVAVDELRRDAEVYRGAFEAAVVANADSPADFRLAAEDLLVPLDGLELIAQSIDQAAEQRATASLADIDEASSTGTFILLGVILGLGAMGAMLGFAVLRMIQDQRRLVVAEQAASAQLAAAARAKADFIADASHELRTPLTVLRGNAEIGLALDDACQHGEILREIVDEAARMSGLVDDLLFLARSDAASVPLEPAEVDLATMLESIASRAEVLARERGAVLAADLRAAGPARLDAVRIGQALLILVDNAAKYGPPGGTVVLSTASRDGRLILEVRDRGPGIPAEDLSRVFERFYRTDAARERPSGGTGLGLAIAAAIVDGHGGRIEAVRRDGGGTTMRASLPLLAARAAVVGEEP